MKKLIFILAILLSSVYVSGQDLPSNDNELDSVYFRGVWVYYYNTNLSDEAQLMVWLMEDFSTLMSNYLNSEKINGFEELTSKAIHYKDNESLKRQLKEVMSSGWTILSITEPEQFESLYRVYVWMYKWKI